MVTQFAKGAILQFDELPPVVSLSELSPPGGLVVLTPHADDETLGCGCALAATADAGRAISVVVLTDGALSHPKSQLYPRERLIALRERELKAAVASLTSGHGRVEFLGYPDQGAPHDDAGCNKAARRLLTVVDAIKPAAIWTTWVGDPHPDHQAAAKIAESVVRLRPRIRLWSFPIWGRFTDQPLAADEQLFCYDQERYKTRKATALTAYQSQMTHLIEDDPDGFVMDLQAQKHFLTNPEFFVRHAHAR